MNKRTGFSLLSALGVVMAAGYVVIGMVSTYRWTPPITGAPPAHYVIQLEIRTDNPNPNVRVYVDGAPERMRVAGVDSQGRQGVFSNWSAWSDTVTVPEVLP